MGFDTYTSEHIIHFWHTFFSPTPFPWHQRKGHSFQQKSYIRYKPGNFFWERISLAIRFLTTTNLRGMTLTTVFNQFISLISAARNEVRM